MVWIAAFSLVFERQMNLVVKVVQKFFIVLTFIISAPKLLQFSNILLNLPKKTH